jgi:hypothetical protein
MKPDGSGERILTSGYHNEGPTFAPNGRVVMFLRDPGGNSAPSLYTVDISGRFEQRVPTPGFASRSDATRMALATHLLKQWPRTSAALGFGAAAPALSVLWWSPVIFQSRNLLPFVLFIGVPGLFAAIAGCLFGKSLLDWPPNQGPRIAALRGAAIASVALLLFAPTRRHERSSGRSSITPASLRRYLNHAGNMRRPLWLALHKQDCATRLSLTSLTQAAIDRWSEAEVSRWEKQKENLEGALRRAHS